MNIGFVNIFSYRPHVEHLFFLSSLMEGAGHKSFYLTCDANLSNCYSRVLKGTSKVKECPQCILGGIRSYTADNIVTLKQCDSDEKLSSEEKFMLTLSSSCTLSRTESELEWDDDDVRAIRYSLEGPVEQAYQAALAWIKNNKLECVICFNGRMDITRAITYACEQLEVPYITHERTWFGDGLLLIPNANCLSLQAVRKMVQGYDNKPLTQYQARLAGRLIGERFLQKNILEWRLYNKNPEPIIGWPTKPKGRRVLVLPSSKNEFAGHNEWKCGWVDNTKALDDFFKVFAINRQDVVIRFHPNWSENIGKVSGERPLKLYKAWAEKNKLFYISSEEKANTYDLIQQADIVVLNGGSSAVEAGACGKQVVCLGSSTYDKAGFVKTYLSKEEMEKESVFENIDEEMIIKKTLRFVYLSARRFPQYTDFVKAIKTTRYKYFQGADPQRIIDMIKTGELLPDDETYSSSEEDEKEVVKLLQNRDWAGLSTIEHEEVQTLPPLIIQRRFGLRWIDKVRERLSLGDR